MDTVKDLLNAISSKGEAVKAQLPDLLTEDIRWMETELTRAVDAMDDALYILEATLEGF
jgi:hypothetical protein